MTSIEMDAREYLKWMAIHNYAKTTMKCRSRYLGYFTDFARLNGVDRSEDVTLELLVSYQQSLFAHLGQRETYTEVISSESKHPAPISWPRRAMATSRARLEFGRQARRTPYARQSQ